MSDSRTDHVHAPAIDPHDAICSIKLLPPELEAAAADFAATINPHNAQHHRMPSEGMAASLISAKCRMNWMASSATRTASATFLRAW